MGEKTIIVTWITTVEERYTAEIPLDEYRQMVDAGTYADDLAKWENSPISIDVPGRDITSAGDDFDLAVQVWESA